jgi:hypothetical protein
MKIGSVADQGGDNVDFLSAYSIQGWLQSGARSGTKSFFLPASSIAPACSIAWRDVSEKSTGQRMRSIRGMMKMPSHVVEHRGLPLI